MNGPWEKSVRDPDAYVNHQVFDGFGQLRRVDESGPPKVESGWPVNNNTATTLYDYDGGGRLTKIHDADGIDTLFTHDGEGRRLSIARVPASGSTTRKSWRYAYNANGSLARKQDPDDRVTTYNYDALERISTETVVDPGPELRGIACPQTSGITPSTLGMGTLSYVYDTSPINGVAGRTYENRVGRLAGVKMFTQCDSTNPYATAVYGYDPLGHAVAQDWRLNLPETGGSTGSTFTMSRAFGPTGLLQSAVFPNAQSATWAYDGRGKIHQINAAGKLLATYAYSLAGFIRERFGLGGSPQEPQQVQMMTHDIRGRRTSEMFLRGDGTGLSDGYITIQGTAHTPAGDLLQFSQNNNMDSLYQVQVGFTFRYDGLHRLIASDCPATKWDGTSLNPYTLRLNYSNAGNIQISWVTLPNPARLPNRFSSYYGYGNGDPTDPQAATTIWKNGNTGPTLAQMTYDAAGNLTGRTVDATVPGGVGLNTHSWYDSNDQMRAVLNTSTGVSERYFFDHTRHRFLAIRNDGSWRFYLGDEYEVDHPPVGGTERDNAYIGGTGEALARVTTSCTTTTTAATNCPGTPTVSMLYHERRGDLLAALGTDGSIQAHFLYGPLGEVLYSYESITSDWRRRFNGKEQDQIDQLSYYGYRYYDPLTMRWTSADPLYRFAPDVDLTQPQKQNLYTFSVNNPLRYVDPNGLASCSAGGDTYTTCARKVRKEDAHLSGSALTDFVKVTTGQRAPGQVNDPGNLAGHAHGVYNVPSPGSHDFVAAGLYFETSSARDAYVGAMASALQSAMQGENTAALADLGRLAVDSRVDVHITDKETRSPSIDTTALLEGAYNKFWPNGPSSSSANYSMAGTIAVNLDATSAQHRALTLGYSTPSPPSAVIGHEVGHVTGDIYHGFPMTKGNVPNESYSVDIENIIRGPLGPRPIH